MNNKWIWWAIGIVVVLGILFYIPRLNKPQVTKDVPCLVPNVPLSQHIHPILKITVDGQPEVIPANLGLAGCERALHTHDETGTLHVEAQNTREYTLADFFSVWGKKIKREGYTVTMTVDGQPSEEFGSLLLKDKQEIVLSYVTK